MKIRHPVLIKLVALLLSWAFRLWLGSITYRVEPGDRHLLPRQNKRKSIYLFWHEMMLIPAYAYTSPAIAVLASHHADGELIARTVEMLGGRTVRGSTNKRGMTALRVMMRYAGHLAITPDGPRGPRRVVQSGAIYLASRTGMPIVVAGLAYRRCHQHRSWDRMAIPFPGTVAQTTCGEPIEIPPELDRGAIETYRQRVQQALDAAQAQAERLVHQPLLSP